ncbi:MAG: hypothetical protein J5944_07000 [Lentisphaeria bacterium]|nr:hypothetical protein [Lentisphaeria bacterium]
MIPKHRTFFTRSARFAAALLFLSLPALAEETAKISVAKIAEAPEIDGQGTDACWSALPWYSGFTLINQKETKAPQETKFKVAHDNDHLYFLIEAEESEPARLNAKVSERDNPRVAYDDCVEVFIDPNRDFDRFYHFIVNTTGALYDAEYLQGGFLTSKDWDSEGLKIGTAVHEKSFTVELAIPLVELGLENISGRMGINVARESYAGGKPVLSSFVPIDGSFGQPALFAPAQLEKCDLKHFAWKIGGPVNPAFLRREGKIVYEGKFYLGNSTGKLQMSRLTLRFKNGPTFGEHVILDNGLGREYSFSLPVDVSIPDQMLHLELKDNKTGQKFASRQIPVSVSYSPLSITLTNPPYRDNIYSDMNVTEIAGDLVIGEAGSENFPVTFELADSDGKILASGTGAGSCKFRLPIPALEEGDYLLTVRAGEYTGTKKIRKLPKVKGEVRFDENGYMLADGQSVIPYGGFSCNPDRESALGFNLNFSYMGSYLHGQKLQETFDRYAELGLKTAINCYPSDKISNPEAMRKPLTKQEADQIRSRIRELRSHPALLGWYLADEPEAVPALPSRLKEIYEICKEEDPHHPAIILNNTAAGYRKYAEVADITMPDAYPNFLSGGDAGKPIREVYDLLKLSSEVNARIQWITPQAFNWGDYSRTGQRAPDFAELRNMHYQAILAGATGFCWFEFSNLQCEPEVYLGLAQLLKETKILNDLWFNGYKRVALDTGDPDVLAAACPGNDGRHYIVTVNCSTSPKDISLPAEGKIYFAAGEKQSFTPVEGKLTDQLTKYQTRVYVTDQALAESFSLDEYKPKVAEAMAKLYKEGNLAYSRKGRVRFELSWDKRSSAFWHLGDGAFNMMFWIRNSKPKDTTVSITFPEKVKASRLCLFGKNLRRGIVEAEVNGEWVRLAELKPAGEKSMEASFPAVESAKFRISELSASGISEIEMYGPSQEEK